MSNVESKVESTAVVERLLHGVGNANGRKVHKLGTNFFIFDGYCSTVQGLLDWFEVDLGFTKLSFIQIDLCLIFWRKECLFTEVLNLSSPPRSYRQ